MPTIVSSFSLAVMRDKRKVTVNRMLSNEY